MNNTQETLEAATAAATAAAWAYQVDPSADTLAALQAATHAVRLAAVADGAYPA
jgi:hypothetical protein